MITESMTCAIGYNFTVSSERGPEAQADSVVLRCGPRIWVNVPALALATVACRVSYLDSP